MDTKTPEADEFSTSCAERAAPMFVVRGRPIRADRLAQQIKEAVGELAASPTQAVESGGVLVMRNDAGIGVYVHVDTLIEEE